MSILRKIEGESQESFAFAILKFMKLILIRHVETFGNLEHRFNGKTESPYTDRGYRDKNRLVLEAAEYLKGEENVLILSSPIQRALTIAKEIGEKTSFPVLPDDHLREFDFGIFDGMTAQEAEACNREAYMKWIFDHLHEKIPQGDSYEQKYLTIKEWLGTLLDEFLKNNQENCDAILVIVAHGAVLRMLLTTLLDLPMDAGWHLDLKLGGSAVIDYEAGYGILRSLNAPFPKEEDGTGYVKKFIR